MYALFPSLGAIPSFVSPLEDGSSSKSIPETTVIGTSIYSIEALDSDDQTGASITYDIVSQVPAELFELSVEDRTTVETTGEFDFETGVTTFTLTFRWVQLCDMLTVVLKRRKEMVAKIPLITNQDSLAISLS